MKTTMKGLKFEVQSPNEDINAQFSVDEISFEADLEEIREMYKYSKEILPIIASEIIKVMDATASFTNTMKGDC